MKYDKQKYKESKAAYERAMMKLASKGEKLSKGGL